MKHTQTPWHTGRDLWKVDVFDRNGFQVVTQNALPISERYYYGELGDGHWGNIPESHIERPDEEQSANAAFIVRAVNAHEPLVKALTRLMKVGRLANADDYEIARKALDRTLG